MAVASDPLVRTGAGSSSSNGTAVKDYKTMSVEEEGDTAAGVSLLDSVRIQHDDDNADIGADFEINLNAHKTTYFQTYIHLLKGYIGCGVLSLPWAVSQLGISCGCLFIGIMALWSSYNCWTVVKLKRYIEKKNPAAPVDSDAVSDTASSATTNTNITYPDVGEWAYGKRFENYIAVCVCVQQLAICTVFLSFIGENLLAVLQFANIQLLSTHTAVITVALPAVMSLSFLPNLKSLAPVMAAGTILMLIGFGALAVMGVNEWGDRPESAPVLNPPQAPLAVCAILYSYEGICLVLPVESAMKDPQHFKSAFVWSMTTVAIILGAVASLSVLVFGNVTNGSITAFLLDTYQDDASVTFWLMVANAAVSVSVLLTYPLQLFPALELFGPALANFRWPWKAAPDMRDDLDLDAFEPLPTLFEHDTMSQESLPEQHHDYGDTPTDTAAGGDDDDDEDTRSRGAMSNFSVATSFFPEMPMPGDSPLLRASLVLLTYMVAVVVPNVQSLISLAGAVAGSSTALLIPPILELAWIQALEKELGDAENTSTRTIVGSSRYRWSKVKSWFLLIMGLIFALFGSVASITDIVRIYHGEPGR